MTDSWGSLLKKYGFTTLVAGVLIWKLMTSFEDKLEAMHDAQMEHNITSKGFFRQICFNTAREEWAFEACKSIQ